MLQLRRVNKSYQIGGEHVSVLKNISFTLQPGELVCLVGSSGSGKNTLINVISGLESLDQGEIEFITSAEKDRDAHEWELLPRSMMGIVCRPREALGNRSVREDLLMMPELFLMEDEAKGKLVEEILAIAGLQGAADYPLSSCSLEQALCLAVARVMIRHPKLLVFEEFPGLGEEAIRCMVHLLRRIADQGTMVLLSLDRNWPCIRERKLVMEYGRIVEEIGC